MTALPARLQRANQNANVQNVSATGRDWPGMAISEAKPKASSAPRSTPIEKRSPVPLVRDNSEHRTPGTTPATAGCRAAQFGQVVTVPALRVVRDEVQAARGLGEVVDQRVEASDADAGDRVFLHHQDGGGAVAEALPQEFARRLADRNLANHGNVSEAAPIDHARDR